MNFNTLAQLYTQHSRIHSVVVLMLCCSSRWHIMRCDDGTMLDGENITKECRITECRVKHKQNIAPAQRVNEIALHSGSNVCMSYRALVYHRYAHWACKVYINCEVGKGKNEGRLDSVFKIALLCWLNFGFLEQ